MHPIIRHECRRRRRRRRHHRRQKQAAAAAAVEVPERSSLQLVAVGAAAVLQPLPVAAAEAVQQLRQVVGAGVPTLTRSRVPGLTQYRVA